MKKYRYMISVFGLITSILAFSAGADRQAESHSAVCLMEQAETCSYIIQKGDTLSDIALRLTGRSDDYSKIMDCNGLLSEAIYPGDMLHIPRQLLLPDLQRALDSQKAATDSAKPSTGTVQQSTSAVHAEIEILVFKDRNNNGEYDTDEPGVSGIQVILVREGSMQSSDQEGLVLFIDVEPGDHTIGVDESTLPEGYQLSTKSTVLLSVSEGDKGYVAFGIYGSISK